MSGEDDQRALCQRVGASFSPPSAFQKVGVALATLHLRPLHGLRHPPEHGTSGWYVWGGAELSPDPDFFQPLHVHHLAKHCPDVMPYLALPPGYRFLIDADHEDVWTDPSLLAM
jgi:hypothetical protein